MQGKLPEGISEYFVCWGPRGRWILREDTPKKLVDEYNKFYDGWLKMLEILPSDDAEKEDKWKK